MSLPTSPPGPRHPLGPDVPFASGEIESLGEPIIVSDYNSSSVQLACDLAAHDHRLLVLLAAGEYLFDSTVRVSAGLTLAGVGSATVCFTRDPVRRSLFAPAGDNVRITRMTLRGFSPERDTANHSQGVANSRELVRLDHLDVSAFCHATTFGGGSAQVDHCVIHDNPRDGLGYGVCVMAGAHVLVADSDISQCRHHLASNGAIDWAAMDRLRVLVQKPGVRKTHWELVHNRLHHHDRTQFRFCAVDTHPGMDGTFLVEGNVFECLNHAIGIRDGSGAIRDNLFRDISGPLGVAISVFRTTHNFYRVPGAMPHDVLIHDNRFENVQKEYLIDAGENIIIEGRLVESTRCLERPAQEPAIHLHPRGLEYAPLTPLP